MVEINMHRSYCKNLNLAAENIQLTDQTEIHHIKNVLRLKKGSQIIIFSQDEKEALGEISQITSESISVKIIKVTTKGRTNETQLILVCALPKKGKFELIIEKSTELGIHEIYPLQTKRTEVILKGERLDKKLTRFNTVAINAAKQSKRRSVPCVHPISKFEDCIQALKNSNTTILIPSLQEKAKTLSQCCAEILPVKRIAFLIGPEGDFTAEEYALAEKEGCLPVTLGPTILKVETAAICVTSFLRQQTLAFT